MARPEWLWSLGPFRPHVGFFFIEASQKRDGKSPWVAPVFFLPPLLSSFEKEAPGRDEVTIILLLQWLSTSHDEKDVF